LATKQTNTVEVKNDILWRVYACYLLIIVLCLWVVGKAVYIQQVQGAYWRGMSDSLHQRIEEIDAERGTIYSEDGQMLSTSIPQFDVHIDFAADGLREKNGVRFRENVDSLSMGLAALFGDKTADEYKRLLQKGYQMKDRYFLLKRKISFRDFQRLQQLPLVRLGRNKSGFIADDKSIRLNPYQLLAYRTIGLDRENAQKVGLEQQYDAYLKGTTGKRLVRSIGGGVSVPVDESYEIEPENGKDIITTLDIHIQEISENALMKMMLQNQAEYGCAIVMEVKTGKIKAIANLGRRNDSAYWENLNYALSPTEPGSTFKLATIMAVLEDKKATLNTPVNLEGGTWNVANRTVYDSETHGRYDVTLQQAFELSSNVGMAKLAMSYYSASPSKFLKHLEALGITDKTGIDLAGEGKPIVYKPGSKYWSNATLPWMSFGYGLAITPLRTAMLYNAVANKGVMMKPYLVNSVVEDGIIIKQFVPQVVNERICSESTLKQLKVCLEGVCTNGTGKRLFEKAAYKAAGKTGTALVADGKFTYADKVYQSSFAGYFPAENPQYTIVVIIRNKPHAARFYGADVAGPVWKEIADRLYTLHVRESATKQYASLTANDSTPFTYAGAEQDVAYLNKHLQLYKSNTTSVQYAEWLQVQKQQGSVAASLVKYNEATVPNLIGLGLKDATYLCESLGMQVQVRGKGKVKTQSITAGATLQKGSTITLILN